MQKWLGVWGMLVGAGSFWLASDIERRDAAAPAPPTLTATVRAVEPVDLKRLTAYDIIADVQGENGVVYTSRSGRPVAQKNVYKPGDVIRISHFTDDLGAFEIIETTVARAVFMARGFGAFAFAAGVFLFFRAARKG